VGEAFSLSVIGEDAVPLPALSARWSIADATVAVISPDGRLVARRPGRTSVVAKYGHATAKATIDVLPEAVHEFRLSPAGPNVAVGNLVTLQAISSDGPVVAIWKSSSPRIAAALGDGVFRALRPGTAEICASGGDRRSCTTMEIVR
jgi:hypothetical protein